MYLFSINHDYTDMFNIELLEGETLKEESANTMECLLNKEALNAIGIESPIGKEINAGNLKITIKGIVKNYNFESLHKEIKPQVIVNMPRYYNYVFIKFKPAGSNIPNTLSFLKNTFKRIDPSYVFDYGFVDEELQSQYLQEENLMAIVRYFTILAVFISCLGLFGLASFTAEKKTKEIGIRKVLGASVSGIIRMVTKEFILLVVISNVIAWPAAYFIINKWLQNFAFRTDLSIWFFIFSAFAAAGIALLTIGYQAVKAATAAPVNSLKDE